MKFAQFLNETPRIDNMTVHDKPDSVVDFLEVLEDTHDEKTSWKYKDLIVKEYVRDEYNYSFLCKDETPILYIMYQLNNTVLGKSYTNKFVQKGRISLSPNLLTDFVFTNAKRNKADAIVSDSIQSNGGVSLWKSLLRTAYDKGYEIGVYRKADNKNNNYITKEKAIDFMGEKIDSFDKWYNLVKDFVYGQETFHEGMRFYIKGVK